MCFPRKFCIFHALKCNFQFFGNLPGVEGEGEGGGEGKKEKKHSGD